MSRDWWAFLEDMQEACQKIQSYSESLGQESFACHGETYDAILLNILLLGEAASHIPPAVRDTLPEVPSREVVATRNSLIHGYFAINDAILWEIVHREVPMLAAYLTRLREQRPSLFDNKPI